MLLLSRPGFESKTVYVTTRTAQVAPTILKALRQAGPGALDAVKIEGTAILPEVQGLLEK